MRKHMIIAAAVALAGCTTTSGIQPIGPDTFLLSKGQGHGFSGSAGLKGEVVREANEFCRRTGKQMKVHSMAEQPQGPMGYPSIELQFLCLADGDKELTRPKLEPAPSAVIENRTR